MTHTDLLKLLLPPVAYEPGAPNIAAELYAEGRALDTALDYSHHIAGAITPYFAEQLLVDWERVVGITPNINTPYLARINAVVAKIRETGGLNIPYFINLAAGMGYTITITEPRPFRAGEGRAGDTIYDFDVVWQWRVNVAATNVPQYPFRAGTSAAGESILAFGDPVIEQVINDLKPAHTFVYFAYA